MNTSLLHHFAHHLLKICTLPHQHQLPRLREKTLFFILLSKIFQKRSIFDFNCFLKICYSQTIRTYLDFQLTLIFHSFFYLMILFFLIAIYSLQVVETLYLVIIKAL
jgi:hypothetical protein